MTFQQIQQMAAEDAIREALGRTGGVVVKTFRSASGTFGNVIKDDQRASCMLPDFKLGIHRCRSQLQMRQPLGCDSVGQIAQQTRSTTCVPSDR